MSRFSGDLDGSLNVNCEADEPHIMLAENKYLPKVPSFRS